jgi:tetratricopeptide (TPR) repeat protein/CHAT domain-containing protein
MSQDRLLARYLFDQGMAACQADRLEEAIGFWTESKAICARLGLTEHEAECNLNIGIALCRLGKAEQALGHLEQARSIFRSNCYSEGFALVGMNIGIALDALGRPDLAIAHWRQASMHFQRLRLEEEEADCNINISAAFDKLAQPQQAMEYGERARAVFLRLRREEKVADSDVIIGNVLLTLKEPQKAIERYRQAAAVFLPKPNSIKDVAGCYMGIGLALNDLGQPQQAIEYFALAEAAFNRLGLKIEEARCQANIGIAFLALGRPQKAREYLEKAAKVFHDLDLKKDEAVARKAIGASLLALEPQQAIEYNKQAQEVFRSLELKKEVAESDLNIGVAFLKLGQPEQAKEHFEQAKAIFIDLDLKGDAAGCDVNIGAALIALGQPQLAIKHLEGAKAELKLNRDVAYCDNNLGVAYADLAATADPETARARYQQALDHLDSAILICEHLRSTLSVTGLRLSFFEQYIRSYRLAIHCCLRLGRITDALHYLERSHSKVLAETVSGNLVLNQEEINEIGEELYAEFLNLRARLHQMGLMPMVMSDFNTKPESYDSGYTRTKTQRDFDTLVQRIAKEFPNSAFTRKLAATEVRHLKKVDEYFGLVPDDRSCLLEFLAWADDGRLRAFLLTSEQTRKKLELIVFPEGSLERLDKIWQQWKRMYVDAGKLSDEEVKSIVCQTCHQLHELIFAADIEVVRQNGDAGAATDTRRQRLLDYLNTTLEQGGENQPRRMYLIPHAQLFYMPLHAACWSEQSAKEPDCSKQQESPRPHYLIEDYLCIYAPSAYLLKVSQERQYEKPEEPRAIVVGNPKPLPEGMKLLPGAKTEAGATTKLLTEVGWKVDLLIEEDATKQRYLDGDEGGVAGINKGVYYHQHLALHGDFGTDGEQAKLFFAPSSEGFCYARDIAGAPLQATRCVIAAFCYSSATDLRGQSINEYLGMGAAFLQARVGTFIGTLYPLSDEGSRWLVPELYRLHLQEGLSWAAALRRAQLQMAGVTVSDANPPETPNMAIDSPLQMAGITTPDANGNKRGGPTMTAGKLGLLEKNLITETWESEAEQVSRLNHPYHWAAFTISGKE